MDTRLAIMLFKVSRDDVDELGSPLLSCNSSTIPLRGSPFLPTFPCTKMDLVNLNSLCFYLDKYRVPLLRDQLCQPREGPALVAAHFSSALIFTPTPRQMLVFDGSLNNFGMFPVFEHLSITACWSNVGRRKNCACRLVSHFVLRVVVAPQNCSEAL